MTTAPDTPRSRYPGPSLTLCKVCMVAAGFWSPTDPVCPACAAVLREAGE